MPITLTQQTALITGASRGIGRGIALKLAEQGVKKIAINYKENDTAPLFMDLRVILAIAKKITCRRQIAHPRIHVPRNGEETASLLL